MIIQNEIQECEQAINSERFMYCRKWRTSQYSEEYMVLAYVDDGDGLDGLYGYVSLPLEQALEVLKKHGKDSPLPSRV